MANNGWLWTDGGYEMGPTDQGNVLSDSHIHNYMDSWDINGQSVVSNSIETIIVRTGTYSCNFTVAGSDNQKFTGYISPINQQYIYYCIGYRVDDNVGGSPEQFDLISIFKALERNDGGRAGSGVGLGINIELQGTSGTFEKYYVNVTKLDASDGTLITPSPTNWAKIESDWEVVKDTWNWDVLCLDKTNDKIKFWHNDTLIINDLTASATIIEEDACVRQNALLDGKGNATSFSNIYFDDWGIYNSDSYTDNPPATTGQKLVVDCAINTNEFSTNTPTADNQEKSWTWADIATGTVTGLKMVIEGGPNVTDPMDHFAFGQTNGTYLAFDKKRLGAADGTGVPLKGFEQTGSFEAFPWWGIQAPELMEGGVWTTAKLDALIAGMKSGGGTPWEAVWDVKIIAVGTSLADPACAVSLFIPRVIIY